MFVTTALAADKLSSDELKAKWKLRNAGSLTDADLAALAKDRVDWSDDLETQLKKDPDHLEKQQIDALKKIVGAGPESRYSLFQIMAGARLQNPYSIEITPATATTAASATLKNNNTKTDGFFEANFSTRYIFRLGEWDWQPTERRNKNKSPEADKWAFIFQKTANDGSIIFAPEVDYTIGYSFAGKETPTSVTTSTIASGSDFYTDLTLAEPLLRVTGDHGRFRGEATIEADAGFTTDKSFDRAHPLFFGGVGLQLANLQSTNGATLGDAFFRMRVGVAQFDRPRLTGTAVQLDGFGAPRFEHTVAASAGADFSLRLNKTLLFRAGGNVYFKEQAAWTLSAALSVDPASFFKSSSSSK